MQRDEIRICVMRVGGTNRDTDAADCLIDQGVKVDVLHLNDILRRRNLGTFHGLVIPGGFAYGDYVRAGAIWAKRILAFIKDDLRAFAQSGKPILGICNGFQVLVETGLLPVPELSETPEIALASNKSCKFECRWINLRKNPLSPCIFTKRVESVVKFPIAHGEGRFIVRDNIVLENLVKNNQIVLQYSKSDGALAKLEYPQNPNGSDMDIAGICNPSGTILGLMPHPEDAYWGYQLPDWSERRQITPNGDGLGIFQSMVEYIEQSSN